MKNTFLDLSDIRDDLKYLIIDSRYVEDNAYGESELRLAISFGPNLTNPPRYFFAPQVQPGDCVFALHEVEVTNGNRIRITDSWRTSYPADGIESLEEIINRANTLLAGISDDEYATDYVLKKDGQVSKIKRDLKVRMIEDPQFYYG